MITHWRAPSGRRTTVCASTYSETVEREEKKKDDYTELTLGITAAPPVDENWPSRPVIFINQVPSQDLQTTWVIP